MRATRTGLQILSHLQQLESRTARRAVSTVRSSPWVCNDCRVQRSRQASLGSHQKSPTWTRQLSFSRVRHAESPRSTNDSQSAKEQQAQNEPIVNKLPRPEEAPRAAEALNDKIEQAVEDTRRTSESRTQIPAADHDALPSNVQNQRGDMSKKLQTFMDDLLAKAALAGHKVNAYTGTDYSGIDALRRSIIEQGGLSNNQPMFPCFTNRPQNEASKAAMPPSQTPKTSTPPRMHSKQARKRKWSACWSGSTPGQVMISNDTCP